MKPLFKAIRNHEEIAQRPHRQASLELRPFLRLSHWLKVWRGRVDGPQILEHPCRDELRRKAMQQARAVPEINSEALAKSFRRKRQKARGPDLWTSRKGQDNLCWARRNAQRAGHYQLHFFPCNVYQKP